MSDRERVEALAKVLEGHGGQPFWCACGSPTQTRSAHNEHLADVLLESSAMRDLLAEAKADALREAASAVFYESGIQWGRPDWQKWLRDRSDTYRETSKEPGDDVV